MITEPRFTYQRDGRVHHIKLLLWRWRLYMRIGPRDGAVGLETTPMNDSNPHEDINASV